MVEAFDQEVRELLQLQMSRSPRFASLVRGATSVTSAQLPISAPSAQALGPALGIDGEPTPKQLEVLAKLTELDLYEAGLDDLARPLAMFTNLTDLLHFGRC
jgi:hypothetical protein